MYTRAIGFFALLSFMSFAAEPEKKLPEPPMEVQKKAQTQILTIFKDDFFRAKTSQEKLNLSAKLCKEAADSKDDATGKFMLLKLAEDLASQAGSFKEACSIIDETYVEYDINVLDRKVESIVKSSKASLSARLNQDLAVVSATFLQELYDSERYDLVSKVIPLAQYFAFKAKDLETSKYVTAKVQDAQNMQKIFEKYTKALDLKTKSKDANTNLVVGKYLYFIKHNSKGSEMLLLSNDTALKDLIKKEEEFSEDATKYLELGDAWYDAAQKEEKAKADVSFKKYMEAKATKYYTAVLPELTGITKARVESRLKDIPQKGIPNPWIVIFRSSDPSIWGKDVYKHKNSFATSFENVPDDMKYLKLAKTDKDFIIIEIAKDKLNDTSNGTGVGWQGRSAFRWGGRQLGIYNLEWTAIGEKTKGQILTHAAPPVGYRGWGFGIRAFLDDRQAYTWDGKELPVTVFEISVKNQDLTKIELEKLIK